MVMKNLSESSYLAALTALELPAATRTEMTASTLRQLPHVSDTSLTFLTAPWRCLLHPWPPS
jgi:hypothetical protein